MKYLIEDIKLDPNSSDEDGRPALLHSAENGNLELVKYFIE